MHFGQEMTRLVALQDVVFSENTINFICFQQKVLRQLFYSNLLLTVFGKVNLPVGTLPKLFLDFEIVDCHVLGGEGGHFCKVASRVLLLAVVLRQVSTVASVHVWLVESRAVG